MIVNDGNCETKETYEDEVIINYVIHFAFPFIYIKWFKNRIITTIIIIIIYPHKSFIITLVIFVKNPSVNFVSALLDIDLLILYQKVILFLFNYVINS